MSSIPGLPPRGSDASIAITKVHLHPLCMFVEFWGKFSQSKTEEYEALAKDIQSPRNLFQEMEGSPGDQCLVQIDGTWYRCRIVSTNGPQYEVFIIDKGMTLNTTSSKLAWGLRNHFQLPPEVEYCVLANVLPVSVENRWSPVAQEFLRSLAGKSVQAYVQDVLVEHRTFILHIPCISKQMYEMGFAKNLRPDIFQDFLLMSLQSQSDVPLSPGTPPVSPRVEEPLPNHELFLFPEILAGTVETVVVTDVTNPQRVFCQLKVFSTELKKLSEKITQFYEGKLTSSTVSPQMIGFPCAARGSDGKWFRSILQQVFPANKVVEVLNVDCGTKHVVSVHNIKPLATEFFRMPVVTYICALYGIIDKGIGWTSSQIDYLRKLLLHKTVIAKFEYHSISEGVHYVTLYGDENTNLNRRFGTQERCLLECEKTLADYAIQSSACSQALNIQQGANQPKLAPPGLVVGEKTNKERMDTLPIEDLPLHSTHVAVVSHVSDPSEFWIQTQNHASELDKLMDDIYYLYEDSGHKYLLKSPLIGSYCAAKSQDGDFYRAQVTDVDNMQVKVFFVDYGKNEVLDRDSIRILPEKFKMLPCLALKCTLAGVRPKDGLWSQSACDFFINTVTSNTLKVRATSKTKQGYVVSLTDTQTVREKDLGTLMCSSGLAVRIDAEKQPEAKILTNAPSQIPYIAVSNGTGKKEMCIQALNTVVPAHHDGKFPVFKEHMFPIGSVLDVNVSHIESPNDFWCQLVQNSSDLKLLMHKIQSRYANSEFEPFPELTCVARHPEKSMWYRALIIHKHETPHVNVLFIDYGQIETISLYDLRRIDPEFLTLHGQAFRCSLLNPLNHMCSTNEWSDEAIERFLGFVDAATSNFWVLKCTIYAVTHSEQKIVFNIVDLETPFQSASRFMASLVKSPLLQKAERPSFQWASYCYSTHDIKVGNEEQVTVTYVKSVSQFFCHLDRNADVMQCLKAKVSSCCRQLENMKPPSVFGTLCFAKYTDGQWYRGQIKSTKPVILVNFVDYGETVEVNKSDLLPVPKEADDIMSVPVQAVMCCLSDIPHDVSEEVNHWFEENVTECKFRSLVVAKEQDGKLVVELYCGKTQINLKLRKRFQIEMATEIEVVYPANRSQESSANFAQKASKAILRPNAKDTQTTKQNYFALKPTPQTRNTAVSKQAFPKPSRTVTENGQRVKPSAIQLYRPPPQRHLVARPSNTTGNSCEQRAPSIQQKENIPTESGWIKSNSPEPESEKGKYPQKLPKFTELPSKLIAPGTEAGVYVSHCNSPMSFYVQLVGDEDEIFQLVDKLNGSNTSSGTGNIQELHPGDLVKAEFEEDASWYRAVVRDIDRNETALVEFIDFGNTAKTPISRVGRLDGCFLVQPAYSIHCWLSGAATLEKEEGLDPKVVSAFKEDLGNSGEKVFKCQFIRLTGFLWEVSLEDNDVSVVCKRPATDPRSVFKEEGKEVKVEHAQSTEVNDGPENLQVSLLDSCLECYQGLELMEGQNLEVCITAINESLTFWCQLVDSEDLEKMTSRINDISKADELKAINPEFLLPGSRCLALFADDGLWYRAEVLEKEDEELNVVFVDYGNTSKISVAHVRDMPSDLANTPPLAFLCELDGFDCSHGSWSSDGVSEFAEMTTDKALQLTVTAVTKDDGKVSCSVQIWCEGLLLNEAMKTWWTHSLSENQLEGTEQTLASETQHCATPMKESPQLEGQPDSTHGQEVQSKISGDDLQCETLEEERETVLTGSSETSSEIVSDEEISIQDTLQCDSSTDKLFPKPMDDYKGDVVHLAVSCSSVETEDGLKQKEAVGGESHTVGVEEIAVAITLTEEDNGFIVSATSVSVVSEQQEDDPENICAGSKTTVRKVPHESPIMNWSCTALKQTELELSPVLSDAEKQIKDSGDVSEEKTSGIAERDSEAEEETLRQVLDTKSAAVLCECAKDSGECLANMAPSTDKEDMLQEVVPRAQEEASLKAVFTDEAAEPCEPHEEDSECPNQTPQESMPEEFLPPGPSTALPTESEPHTLAIPTSDLGDLLDEVICLVGEINLTDICRDSQKEKTDESEQLVHTSFDFVCDEGAVDATCPLLQDLSETLQETETPSAGDPKSDGDQLTQPPDLSLAIDTSCSESLQQPEE